MFKTQTPTVLIIGGGAFGTSTAYHLSARGYDKVTVLDRFAPPSKDAAATDINKTVRLDYPSLIYSELAHEAMNAWKSPSYPFSGLFHQTGWIMAADEMANDFIAAVHKVSTTSKAQYISVADIKKKWPKFTGRFNGGWNSLWNPDAGWVPSGEALLRLALAAQENGVSYVHGHQGNVKKLFFDQDGNCTGAISVTGDIYQADIVILAAGAQTGLLTNVKNELTAKAMCIATIQLTPEEVERYSSLPMVDHFEQGMIFPPNETGLLKLCSCRLVTNYHNSSSPGVSVGRSYQEFPDDRIPLQIESELRKFLLDVIPELADKPWESTRMCWDADSKDSNFRICPHPQHKNLFIASAGSLHGFKFLPTIGKYVADMIEGRLDKKYQDLWRWRFGEEPPASNIDRHPYPSRDLAQLDGWKGRDSRAAL